MTLDLVKIIGLISSVAVIVQSVLSCQQNVILSRQTELMQRQLQIDSLSKTKYQLVYDTVYITIRDTMTNKK